MRHTFFCIDGHTAANPVRLVAGGAPILEGGTMSDKRRDFLARFDCSRILILPSAAVLRLRLILAASVRRRLAHPPAA
jgi:proline racemase